MLTFLRVLGLVLSSPSAVVKVSPNLARVRCEKDKDGKRLRSTVLHPELDVQSLCSDSGKFRGLLEKWSSPSGMIDLMKCDLVDADVLKMGGVPDDRDSCRQVYILGGETRGQHCGAPDHHPSEQQRDMYRKMLDAGLALPGGLAKSASVRQTGMLKFLSILADEVLVRVRAASSFLTMHL